MLKVVEANPDMNSTSKYSSQSKHLKLSSNYFLDYDSFIHSLLKQNMKAIKNEIKLKKKTCLTPHYNGRSSLLYVNGAKIYQF